MRVSRRIRFPGASVVRELSQFLCQISGGGLMAGHALAIADGFPQAEILERVGQPGLPKKQAAAEARSTDRDIPSTFVVTTGCWCT